MSNQIFNSLSISIKLKRDLVSLLQIIIIISFILYAPHDVSAKEIKFNFNPPDGISYVQTLKISKVKDMGALGKVTDESKTEALIEIKKTASGYSVTCTPISSTMERDGKVIDSPIFSLLQEVIVTYKLDENGQIVDIHGYDLLEKKIKETLPVLESKSLSSVFSEEAMISKDKAEWNGRIGSFVGEVAELGDVWIGTDEFTLPTGEIVMFYSATKFAQQAKCGKQDCVLIQFSYNTDASALQDFVGKTLKEIYEFVGELNKNPEVKDIEIFGEGERLIDPATMLVYSEYLKRTIKMKLEIPGQDKIMTTLNENMVYSFDYEK